jgi:uncharacterized protein YbaA (DUF1428 family)
MTFTFELENTKPDPTDADPRIMNMMKGKKTPFDSKGMTCGGFKVIVDV